MPDRNELEQWFRQYSQDIYHFLVYYTGSLDVDDLVQDVFLKAYSSMDQFKGVSGIKTWLMKIARNQAIDASRRKKRQTQVVSHLFSQHIATESGPEKIIEGKETLKAFYQVTLQLKQSYREVLLFRIHEQLSVEETAEVLGWNKAKVTLTYHRALKKLQEIFPMEEDGPYGQ